MKVLSFPVLILLLAFAACTKNDRNTYPLNLCLQGKIQEAKNNNMLCDSSASIKQYTFQNKTVYVFDVGYCVADATSEVMDDSCTTLGYLGGFVGQYIINGVSFYDSAVYVTTVWGN